MSQSLGKLLVVTCEGWAHQPGAWSPLMVYISSNTIRSIREEEIVPLGAITVDMGPPTGGSQCHTYIHIYSKYVASEPISREI